MNAAKEMGIQVDDEVIWAIPEQHSPGTNGYGSTSLRDPRLSDYEIGLYAGRITKMTDEETNVHILFASDSFAPLGYTSGRDVRLNPWFGDFIIAQNSRYSRSFRGLEQLRKVGKGITVVRDEDEHIIGLSTVHL